MDVRWRVRKSEIVDLEQFWGIGVNSLNAMPYPKVYMDLSPPVTVMTSPPLEQAFLGFVYFAAAYSAPSSRELCHILTTLD